MDIRMLVALLVVLTPAQAIELEYGVGHAAHR